MKLRTAQRITSKLEVHNVRCIHRARLSAHRIRASATEAHIGDTALARSGSAADPAPTTLAGNYLRPAHSPIRCANPTRAIIGYRELMTIWSSRGSRQRRNAGQKSGQRSGIPDDFPTHQRTQDACQVISGLRRQARPGPTLDRTEHRRRIRGIRSGPGIAGSRVTDCCEEFSWPNDAGAIDAISNIQQIPITGNKVVHIAANGLGQEIIVLTITQHWRNPDGSQVE